MPPEASAGNPPGTTALQGTAARDDIAAGSPTTATVDLATVLGSVTEFNTNAVIFNLSALLLVNTIASMEQIKQIASVHGAQIKGLQASIDQLNATVHSIAGRIPHPDTYRPAQHNQPRPGRPLMTRD